MSRGRPPEHLTEAEWAEIGLAVAERERSLEEPGVWNGASHLATLNSGFLKLQKARHDREVI